MRDREETEFVRVRPLPHGKGEHRCGEDHAKRDDRRQIRLSCRCTAVQTTSAVTPRVNSFRFFRILLKTLPSLTTESRSQMSVRALHQSGTGTVRSRPALPTKSTMTQCPSATAADPVAKSRLLSVEVRIQARLPLRLSYQPTYLEVWHSAGTGLGLG